MTRLRAGPAFPRLLPPIDRVAPVPDPIANAPTPSPESVVLSCLDADGTSRPICSDEGDSLHWRVDPRRWIGAVLAEEYVARWNRPWVSRLPFNYARFPNWLKGAFGGAPSWVDDPDRFPRLPLDDFADALRALCAVLSGGEPHPINGLWPDGCCAAVTITHDVDTDWIFRRKNRALFERILRAERATDFRGAWYIPAAFYDRDRHAEAVAAIDAAGHELGAHGWNHDARLQYLAAADQRERVRRSVDGFAPRRIAGMRTPWYARDARLFATLGGYFRYDSSVPNASAIFSEGTHSGCCTVFPYRPVEDLVELPLTLPPDNFDDLQAGWAMLAGTADAIIERGGVVVVIVHPQPHQTGNLPGVAQLEAFLHGLRERHGDRLWSATPHEIAARYVSVVANDSRLLEEDAPRPRSL